MLFLGIIKNRAYNGIFISSSILKSLLSSLDKINILLLAVPVSFIVNYLYINSIAIFIVNFIAIIPLAIIINYATKEITRRASNILGGLLNITFRNAIKLIVSILALTKGQITIIKTSLISSMLLNLLLIFSIYFFFRGINWTEQYFNIIVVDTTAGLLALCISSLIILTAFYSTLLSNIARIGARAAAISRGGDLNGVIITLRFSTVLVAFCSKFMVNSISNITASGTVSTTFISLILLLIIGNAAKYIIAVIVAYKDEISLVINVAIRSILPFIIILNWLEGVLIMAIYTIIVVASWFYPKQVLDPLCPA
ncbi:hypothetical protein V2W45_1467328 [Cenococcum geophilum]